MWCGVKLDGVKLDLLGDNAAIAAVVSCMSSPVHVLHLPIAVAVMVLPVLGFVTVMGPSQGDSLWLRGLVSGVLVGLGLGSSWDVFG